MLLLFCYVRQVDLILGLLCRYVAWPRWLKTLSLSLSQQSRIGHRLGNPNLSTANCLIKTNEWMMVLMKRAHG